MSTKAVYMHVFFLLTQNQGKISVHENGFFFLLCLFLQLTHIISVEILRSFFWIIHLIWHLLAHRCEFCGIPDHQNSCLWFSDLRWAHIYPHWKFQPKQSNWASLWQWFSRSNQFFDVQPPRRRHPRSPWIEFSKELMLAVQLRPGWTVISLSGETQHVGDDPRLPWKNMYQLVMHVSHSAISSGQ